MCCARAAFPRGEHSKILFSLGRYLCWKISNTPPVHHIYKESRKQSKKKGLVHFSRIAAAAQESGRRAKKSRFGHRLFFFMVTQRRISMSPSDKYKKKSLFSGTRKIDGLSRVSSRNSPSKGNNRTDFFYFCRLGRLTFRGTYLVIRPFSNSAPFNIFVFRVLFISIGKTFLFFGPVAFVVSASLFFFTIEKREKSSNGAVVKMSLVKYKCIKRKEKKRRKTRT